MKKNKSVLWLIAVTVIIGTAFAACENGDVPNGDVPNGDNLCVVCNLNLCECPTDTPCVTCGKNPCECPLDTPCKCAGNAEDCDCDDCSCDECIPPIPNIEDWELYNSILDVIQEITDRGFAQSDDVDFLEAEEALQTAITAYLTNDDEAAALGEEAKNLFESILKNRWIAYLAPIKAAATTERDLAIAERANVASRNIYNDANRVFTQAETDYGNDNFEAAVQWYVEAKLRFAIARVRKYALDKEAEYSLYVAERTVFGPPLEIPIEITELFNQGKALFNQAGIDYGNNNLEAALQGFIDAEPLYQLALAEVRKL